MDDLKGLYYGKTQLLVDVALFTAAVASGIMLGWVIWG